MPVLASAEALALIFVINRLEKFSTESTISDLISAKNYNSFKQDLKDYITKTEVPSQERK